MSQFILPLTIANRKIVFLDLKPEVTGIEISADEDNYITDIPVQNSNSLITLNKKKYLQSLHENFPDVQIENLFLEITYSNHENSFDVQICEKGEQNFEQKEPILFSPGFSLKFHENDNELGIDIAKDPGFSKPAIDHVFFHITYKPENSNYNYKAILKFYIVDRSEIRFAGLDFGSEASQISEASYNKKGQNNIDDSQVNLFNYIKKDLKEKDVDNAYEQFEQKTNFYKSRFYVNNYITHLSASKYYTEMDMLDITSSVLLLTKNSEIETILGANTPIPNLKLIHGNPDYASHFHFTINNIGRQNNKSLAQLKDSIYAALLKKMIHAYLNNSIEDPVYLHFTLLVPNIYTILEIRHLKKIVRDIVLHWPEANKIKGLEISSLSESDASFLGCVNHFESKTGNYYIVIDCGKGTTDFSIILSDKNKSRVYIPFYRNGFAGAGNLISFAFLQSMFTFLKNIDSSQVFQENLKKFISIYFQSGSKQNLRNEIFTRIETWKHNYSLNNSKEKVGQEWKAAKSGSRTLIDLFSSSTPPVQNDISNVLKNISMIYDWGGHVERTIADIAERITDNLSPVIKQLQKKATCGGILLTGRGVLFKPLEEAVLNSFRSLPGLSNIKNLNTDGMDRKSVCLEGIFSQNITTYSDISSTPFETLKGTRHQIRKFDIISKSFIGKIDSYIDKVGARFGRDKSEHYSEEANTLQVLNKENIENCQFFSSGKLYQVSQSRTKDVKKADLILSRSGIYLRLKGKDDKKEILLLTELEPSRQNLKEDLENILKSLFPTISDESLIMNDIK